MAQEFRYMVRMAGKDLDGKKPVRLALSGINGVGDPFANAVIRVLNLDQSKQIGMFSDDEIKRIEEVIHDPFKFNIPVWMVNRRKEWVTGKDTHLVSADLEFSQSRDVDRLKEIRARKGLRHAFGLKVRGQSTKSRGRTGKTVGVSRKKAMEAKKGGAAAEGKKEEKK